MNNRYRYDVCGLSIESDTAFSLSPGEASGAPDIRFTLKANEGGTGQMFPERSFLGQIKNGAGHPSIAVYDVEGGYVLDCHNTARRVEFVVGSDTSWIECYPHPGAGLEDVEVWLFGLVMSFVLQQRNVYSLHAAAVICGGRAVAFLGSNGYGKSTLALYFVQRGHALVTDDVLPIVGREGRPFAVPGAPSMNLWPRTLEELVESGRAAGGDRQMKRRYSAVELQAPFAVSPAPLAAVYLLQPVGTMDQPAESVALPRARALIELLAYTRASTMIGLPAQQRLLETYSEFLATLAVRRLIYPRGFEFLPAVYETVACDLGIANRANCRKEARR
ncbi:MAG TPA: hypothetical protein VNN77_03680 [candidate division Zixibacteria bacterium]|nr:hypothetical protein [candidate division Zixibacteria bacterium]